MTGFDEFIDLLEVDGFFGDDRPCVMHAEDDCSAVLPCALCPLSGEVMPGGDA